APDGRNGPVLLSAMRLRAFVGVACDRVESRTLWCLSNGPDHWMLAALRLERCILSMNVIQLSEPTSAGT
ncbi:MAG TPA: hypothetical protein VK602_06160, partial [Phyllobacterium sp.]|nr:hypothetical protein [Phyllobacterium sp.]